jgi:gliding motility-associated-like protein
MRLIKYNTCGNDTLTRELTIGAIKLDLGRDTFFCAGSSHIIRAKTDANAFRWQDGSTSSTYTATQPGLYWVDAVNTTFGCSVRDSIRLMAITAPVVELGDAITLCSGTDTVLNAENEGADYLWSDGSNSQKFLVNKAGKVWVQVKKDGCLSSDTVLVKQLEAPDFSLGGDQFLCPGQELTLSVGVGDASYRWHDQSTGSTIVVRNPGVYFVDVSNRCGVARDSIVVSQGACTVYIPSAFTPDNNGLNDVFLAKGTGNVVLFHMAIYDRWGGVLFATDDKNKGWNGSSNGVMVPIGTYVYVVKYREQNSDMEKWLKGTVSVIR